MSTSPPDLPPKSLTPDEATTCLWTNLALPGLGSWRAGWRVSGALQGSVAACGFVLSLGWGGWFMTEWVRAGKLPILVIYDNDGALPPGYLKYLLLGLFGLALGWAFLTSLLIRHEAQSNERR